MSDPITTAHEARVAYADTGSGEAADAMAVALDALLASLAPSEVPEVAAPEVVALSNCWSCRHNTSCGQCLVMQDFHPGWQKTEAWCDRIGAVFTCEGNPPRTATGCPGWSKP